MHSYTILTVLAASSAVVAVPAQLRERGLLGAVGSTVGSTVASTGNTAGTTVATIGDTTGSTVDSVGSTVGGTVAAAGNTVGGTVSTVGNVAAMIIPPEIDEEVRLMAAEIASPGRQSASQLGLTNYAQLVAQSEAAALSGGLDKLWASFIPNGNPFANYYSGNGKGNPVKAALNLGTVLSSRSLPVLSGIDDTLVLLGMMSRLDGKDYVPSQSTSTTTAASTSKASSSTVSSKSSAIAKVTFTATSSKPHTTTTASIKGSFAATSAKARPTTTASTKINSIAAGSMVRSTITASVKSSSVVRGSVAAARPTSYGSVVAGHFKVTYVPSVSKAGSKIGAATTTAKARITATSSSVAHKSAIHVRI